MKNTLSHQEAQGNPPCSIPDIEIVDLEEGIGFDSADSEISQDAEPAAMPPEQDVNDAGIDPAGSETQDDSGSTPQKKRFRVNLHMILIASILLTVFIVFFRFKNWGNFISQEEIRDNIEGTYEDNLDLMIPLTDEEGMLIPLNTEDGLSIVFFGNAPLADDRDSDDNIVNMIADLTGADVYNCSIGISYLASEQPYFSLSQPLDAYTSYWLAVYAGGAGTINMFQDAARELGENIPEDAQEALDTLSSIDFSTVDVIAFMYDGYDYLLGHPMSNGANPTDITYFTGNLEASIEYLQITYPHIRIIVMSPTYAFSNEVDENGDYVSSDIVRYGQDVLSTYVILEGASCSSRQVTFIDNLYGTITEDNAKDYLIDNRHLNVEGRKLVAERFVHALNYFN